MIKYVLAVALAVTMARAQAAEEPPAKGEPLVVNAVLESVDVDGGTITAKWVTGNDVGSVLWLFASKGDLLDPKVFPPRNSVQLSPENNPKLVNVPVQPTAKIVRGKDELPLKDLRAGSVVSLELAADPMKGLAIVGIEVVEKPRPEPAAGEPAAGEPAAGEPPGKEPKGKGGPPTYRVAFEKAITKETEILTPDEAIKQRGQEKVTVQFKVAAVKMGWSTGRVPKGSKTSPCWFQLDDGNDFCIVLKGGPTYRLEQLGIDATRHFEGKVVKATGRVLGEQPPFSIGVDDLDQFEVVQQTQVKGAAAPEKDPLSGTKLEKKVLTCEEAILQCPKEPVTVQLKIAEVHATPGPRGGFGNNAFLLKDGGKLLARIEEPARAMILNLGIEPEKYFLGKVIWVTGLVEPLPGTGAEPSFHIRVNDLTQLKVIKEQQPAPADPKKSDEKPVKDEKLLALIDQILTAHGGEEKLNKLQFTMTVKIDNGTTDKYFVQPPKNFRWETTHQDSKTKRICILLPHGRQFWMQEPGEPAKPFHYFGAELPMPYHLDRAKFFGPREVLRLNDPDHEVARLEEIKIDGRPAVGLHVTYVGKERLKVSHKLYFDQETHLLANLGETYYSDYKTIDGIPIARKEKHPHAGTGPWEAEVTEFRVVDKFDEKLFVEP
jgi:hypothetical protein